MPPSSAMMPRRRLHRRVFLLAAAYNIGWGAWTAVDPQWLFRFAEMDPMRHPGVYACVGMIVGLYGLVYAEVARRPERGSCSRPWGWRERCWARRAG